MDKDNCEGVSLSLVIKQQSRFIEVSVGISPLCVLHL